MYSNLFICVDVSSFSAPKDKNKPPTKFDLAIYNIVLRKSCVTYNVLSESESKDKFDVNHIKINDPGKVEGNAVFSYLDAFCLDEHFKKYLPEYNNLNELKEHYRRGGLGDIKIKKFLNEILQEELEPIRKRREEYSKDINKVYEILKEGTKKARIKAEETLSEVRKNMGIEYFK